jgi:fructose-1,6-bisphosphatase I
VLYEAAPLAFVAEQAGGAASAGVRRIMDIEPASLHERTPLFIGSSKDVRECEEFLQGRHPALAAGRERPKSGA